MRAGLERFLPSSQIENMLSFKQEAHPDCHTSETLRATLRQFHNNLCRHCGSLEPSFKPRCTEDSSVRDKLKKLLTLLVSSEGEDREESGEQSVTTLQQLITETMIAWGSRPVQSSELIQEVFSLLYRQFDEIHDVVQTLSRTYIVDVGTNKQGLPRFDIPHFQQALSSLRLLLKVGMGQHEEKLLRAALK